MRVIAGTLRGRTLKAPKGSTTRPTTDKVREAWFNILGNVSGARVLELYAGTGALGIEALSRGAGHAVFVEAWAPAQRALLENLEQLGLTERSIVLKRRVESALKALLELGPFDLVLADPPWTELERSLERIERTLHRDLLAHGAHVFVGHPSKFELAEPFGGPELERVDRRAWGDSGATLFVRSSPKHG